jgi:hypothetical protein
MREKKKERETEREREMNHEGVQRIGRREAYCLLLDRKCLYSLLSPLSLSLRL